MIFGSEIPIYEYMSKNQYSKGILKITEKGYDIIEKGIVTRSSKNLPLDIDKYKRTGYITRSDGANGTYDLIILSHNNIAASVSIHKPKPLDEMVKIIRETNERGVLYQNISNDLHILHHGTSFCVDRELFIEARKTLPLMIIDGNTSNLFYNGKLIFSSESDNYSTIMDTYKTYQVLSYLKDNEILCMIGYTDDKSDNLFKVFAMYPLGGGYIFEEIGSVNKGVASGITRILRDNDRDVLSFSVNDPRCSESNILMDIGAGGGHYTGIDLDNAIDIIEAELGKCSHIRPGVGSEISAHIDKIKSLSNSADEFGLLKDILPPFTKDESKELQYITERLSEKIMEKDMESREA